MKIQINKKDSIQLNDIQARVLKKALEYSFINADKYLQCEKCQKRLMDIVSDLTELVDGKNLYQKIEESKARKEVEKNEKA
jgi:hypothetical protein